MNAMTCMGEAGLLARISSYVIDNRDDDHNEGFN